MRLFYLTFFLWLLPLTASAAPLANLSSSLDTAQVQYCEAHYKKLCTFPESQSVGEALAKEVPCMENYLQHDPTCHTAYELRKILAYPPTEMRRYPKGIVVLTITTFADDQTVFYIVAQDGKLSELTQDDALVKANPQYQKLKQKYPELAFTNFVFWLTAAEDQFPKAHPTADDGLELIFQQELRNGSCVACEPVGIADVAYRFNKQGQFLGIRIANIKALPETFKR